jgi:hypothetical protein
MRDKRIEAYLLKAEELMKKELEEKEKLMIKLYDRLDLAESDDEANYYIIRVSRLEKELSDLKTFLEMPKDIIKEYLKSLTKSGEKKSIWEASAT